MNSSSSLLHSKFKRLVLLPHNSGAELSLTLDGMKKVLDKVIKFITGLKNMYCVFPVSAAQNNGVGKTKQNKTKGVHFKKVKVFT